MFVTVKQTGIDPELISIIMFKQRRNENLFSHLILDPLPALISKESKQ